MRVVGTRIPTTGEDRKIYSTVDSTASVGQTVFAVNYDEGKVAVWLNGIRLVQGQDFTYTASGVGSQITLSSSGIVANDYVEVVGYQGIYSGNALVEDRFVVGTSSTGSGGSYTNSTTVFPVANNTGDLVCVYRNGIKLVHTTDFVVSASGNTVTLQSASNTADEITVHVIGILQHSNFVPVTGGTFTGEVVVPTLKLSSNVIKASDGGSTITLDTSDNVTIAGNATVDGNLTVSGTTTTINTTITASDAMVVNNAGSDVGLKINSTSSGHIMQLQDNSTDVMVVKDGGNVGIGTGSPSSILNLHNGTGSDGDGARETKLTFSGEKSNGSVKRTGSIKGVHDGTGSDDLGRLEFEPGEAGTKMTIDSSGNVGIGITPESGISADASSLQVGDLLSFSAWTGANANDFHALSYNAYKTGSDSWKAQRTSSSADYRPSQYAQAYGQHYFRVATSATADSAISFSNAMTINNSGNVGIGVSPNYTGLQIHGTTNQFGITNSTTGSALTDGFGIAMSGVNAQLINKEAGYLALYTNDTERMRIDSAGNVGIGTASPVGDLHISESGASEVRLQMTNSNTGHAGSDGMALVLSADGLHRYLWNYENQTFHIGTNNVTQMQFASYDVTDGHKACRVSLGYGALDDLLSCGLQVNSHRYYTQGAVFKDRDGSTSYAGTLLQFYRQSTSVGSITTSGSATAFNTSSDYRLKYDIKDMGSGLNIINDLKPRTFKWLVNKDTKRDDGTKFNNPDTYGFIAHEVEEAIPRANDIGFVQGEKDGEGYQSVDYTKFSPIIIKAIQELSAKVTALEKAS